LTDEHLTEVGRVHELGELDLSEDAEGLTDAGLAHLKELRQLRSLHLSGTNVTLAGLDSIKDLPRLVQVSHSGWENKPIQEVEDFKAHRNRRYASLSEQERRSEAAKALRFLANWEDTDPNDVRAISFSQCWTTDADLAYLQSFPELEQLDLRDNGAITTAGLLHLKGLPNLKSLFLLETAVTSVEPLQDVQSLEELDLSSLPDLQVDTLRFLRPLKRLRRLRLCFGEFDDSIIPYIAQLTTLVELELNENHITDAGLEQLAPLKNLARLKVDYADERLDILERLLGPGFI
jgi:internalin A